MENGGRPSVIACQILRDKGYYSSCPDDGSPCAESDVDLVRRMGVAGSSSYALTVLLSAAASSDPYLRLITDEDGLASYDNDED